MTRFGLENTISKAHLQADQRGLGLAAQTEEGLAPPHLSPNQTAVAERH